jgi:hypothetical protein
MMCLKRKLKNSWNLCMLMGMLLVWTSQVARAIARATSFYLFLIFLKMRANLTYLINIICGNTVFQQIYEFCSLKLYPWFFFKYEISWIVFVPANTFFFGSNRSVNTYVFSCHLLFCTLRCGNSWLKICFVGRECHWMVLKIKLRLHLFTEHMWWV